MQAALLTGTQIDSLRHLLQAWQPHAHPCTHSCRNSAVQMLLSPHDTVLLVGVEGRTFVFRTIRMPLLHESVVAIGPPPRAP